MSEESTSLRTWAWPVGICVGLGIVGLANAIMISIALSHPSVPAAEDHWGASQTWDAELEQRERSAELGWALSAVERGPGPALTLVLADRAGLGLEQLRGQVSLERADSPAHDIQLGLEELGEGRYLAAFERAPSGLVWLAIEVSDAQGRRFTVRERVDLTRGEEARG